jgi:ketosteroid isomerase-like protein
MRKAIMFLHQVSILKRSFVKILVVALSVQAVVAHAQSESHSIYPQIVDTSHASDEVTALFASYFTAKSRHDVVETMEFFSPDMVTYTDATLGWPLDGFAAVKGIFSEYMPSWPETGLSYPVRIIGGAGSAVVAFTDTPELFGGELRILGAIDFKDGKIVRWVDYWDSRSFDIDLYKKMRTPEEKFPTDFKENAIGVTASPKIISISTALQSAFSSEDAKLAASMFSHDAVYEDMTLRTQLLGRAEIERYLNRVLLKAPFGKGSNLRHIVGNDLGGGFEWIGSPMTAVKFGITALELDSEGKISRLTSVYDGRQLRDEELQYLVLLSLNR